MQQPDPLKQQQEQDLCFILELGSRDPSPAVSRAFCLGCGFRHGSKNWRTGTVRVDEDGYVEVLGGGRTVLSANVKEYDVKQQALLSRLSVYSSSIQQLQLECKSGQRVFAKVVGQGKTGVCNAVFQRLSSLHKQRPLSRPRAAATYPTQPPSLRSEGLSKEIRQQLDASRVQLEEIRRMLAQEQQQQAAQLELELLEVQRQLEAGKRQYDMLSAQIERVMAPAQQQAQQPQTTQQREPQQQPSERQVTHSSKRSAEPVVPQSSQPAKRVMTGADRSVDC